MVAVAVHIPVFSTLFANGPRFFRRAAPVFLKMVSVSCLCYFTFVAPFPKPIDQSFVRLAVDTLAFKMLRLSSIVLATSVLSVNVAAFPSPESFNDGTTEYNDTSVHGPVGKSTTPSQEATDTADGERSLISMHAKTLQSRKTSPTRASSTTMGNGRLLPRMATARLAGLPEEVLLQCF